MPDRGNNAEVTKRNSKLFSQLILKAKGLSNHILLRVGDHKPKNDFKSLEYHSDHGNL